MICRTCTGSLDQDAKPYELPLTGSTFKSVPRQSRVRRQEACDTRVSLDSLVSARSISSQEENVSVYLPEGELQRKHLAILNNALTSISEGSFQPFLQYIDYDWNETSEKTKRQYTKKVEEAITLVLRTVAPLQEGPLWQSVINYHLSHERPKNTLVLDAGVEAIVAAYNESENRSTRIQILSLICDKYSQTELQELIPDISRRQIQNTRKHASEISAGETKVSSRHGQSQGIHSFYFKIHISTRCCLWYKKAKAELWNNSTHTSSCANDDNNQNHSFVSTRMQTGRQRTPERAHLF